MANENKYINKKRIKSTGPTRRSSRRGLRFGVFVGMLFGGG